MFFVGLVFTNADYGTVELIIKYFITQVVVSLIFSGLIIIYLFNLSFGLEVFLVTVLIIKLGLFPFHFWVIIVLGKIEWTSFLMLMTLMKLLPILLFRNLLGLINSNFIVLASIIVGSILGFNNSVVQKLLGYSSLVHLCWLILILTVSYDLFLFYYFCYFVMILILVCLLMFMNVYYINQFKLFLSDPVFKFFLFFIILRIAGFPPFMGFIIKWLVVELFLIYDMKLLVTLMVLFSLFSVLYYLELFYYLMMLGGVSLAWYCYSSKINTKFLFLVFFFYFSLYFFVWDFKLKLNC